MKPRTIEQVRADIARVREQIAGLGRADLAVPEADALARLDEHIAGLAEAGNAHLMAQAKNLALRTGQPIYLFDTWWDGRADLLARHIESTICAINPAIYRDALALRVRDFYASGDGAPMAEPERLQRLAKLRDELADLERIEYQTCIEQDLPIRADTNPALVLGL